jgi:hypothetical protein
VPPETLDAFVASWTEDANCFKQQPGYICAQLHRGIAGSGVFLNVAIWESVADYRRAVSNDLSEDRAMTELVPRRFGVD